MVFLLWLAMLMLLVKLMLEVLSMPKLHSINGSQGKHASADCLPLQYMPIGGHDLDNWASAFESLACRNLCRERDASKHSLGSEVGAELGLSVPVELSHHDKPSQRPRTCNIMPDKLL